MSAIEKLKNSLKKNWETIEESQEKEDIRDMDRKIVRKERRIKKFQVLMLYIFVLLLFFWLMFCVVIGICSAPNNDMAPNIKGGDLVMYYRLDKMPSSGDTVVFEKNGTRYVGRVVAKETDTVVIEKTGCLRVNGNAIVEGDIYESTLPREGLLEYPVTLKKDEFFILADARENAEDSRYFGPVKRNDLKGVIIGIFRRTGI